jgi:YfiH family protein
MVSRTPGAWLAIRTADCIPILMADPRTRAIAAVHAGWRGTAARVAARAVSELARQFASRPQDLVAAVGPSIGACCYQVGAEVLEAFRAAGAEESEIREWFAAERGGNRLRLDVAGANRDQLLAAGMSEARVAVCGLCTRCHPEVFHSYRRDGTSAGRLAAVIRPFVNGDGR